MRARFVRPPDGYDATLGELPADLTIAASTRGTFDFLQVFVTRESQLARELPRLKRALRKDGALWISWPKKTSALATGLTGDHVRAAGLAAGLVDVKVCAVDEDWSGLKFVYRVKDR